MGTIKLSSSSWFFSNPLFPVVSDQVMLCRYFWTVHRKQYTSANAWRRWKLEKKLETVHSEKRINICMYINTYANTCKHTLYTYAYIFKCTCRCTQTDKDKDTWMHRYTHVHRRLHGSIFSIASRPPRFLFMSSCMLNSGVSYLVVCFALDLIYWTKYIFWNASSLASSLQACGTWLLRMAHV